jgi:hypothetical protein
MKDGHGFVRALLLFHWFPPWRFWLANRLGTDNFLRLCEPSSGYHAIGPVPPSPGTFWLNRADLLIREQIDNGCFDASAGKGLELPFQEFFLVRMVARGCLPLSSVVPDLNEWVVLCRAALCLLHDASPFAAFVNTT